MQKKQTYSSPQAKVFPLHLDAFLQAPVSLSVSTSQSIKGEEEILNRVPRPRRSADE